MTVPISVPDLTKAVLGLHKEYKLICDANGSAFAYRRVNSMLERREAMSQRWDEVTGEDFRGMTPEELRHVADILEGKGGLVLGGAWTVATEDKKP